MTGCSDVAELEEVVESRVDAVASEDIGYYTVRVSDDRAVLEVRVHTRGIGLEYPFPLGGFWEAVDELAEVAENAILAEVAFGHDSFIDSEVFTNQLADFFDVPPAEILHHMGGGWRPIEEAEPKARDRGPCWYGAGDPLQVAVHIGADSAAVAVPVEVPSGLFGPGHVEFRDTVNVDLRTATTLEELGLAIDVALRRARRQMAHCQGCRRYRQIFQSHEGRRYCRDCMTCYFGLIID